MADARLSYEIDAKDRASATFKKVGAAAKGTKKDLDDTSTGAKRLSRQIDETKDSLAKLNKQFADTGDPAFLKQIRKGERDLKNMQGWADRFPGQIAKSTSALGKLGGALSGVVSSHPALAIAGTGAALAAVPAVAAVAGAALAGVGLGFIGLGAVAVRNSAKVQSAMQGLSNDAVKEFTRAGAVMEVPIARALTKLRGTVAAVGPDMSEMFASVAPHVGNVADGIDGLARNAMPGLKRAVAASGGVLDQLGAKLPETGRALSSFFDSLAKSGEGGGRALAALIGLINQQIGALGNIIEGTSKTFAFFDEGVGKYVTGFGGMYLDMLADTDEKQKGAKESADELAPTQEELAAATKKAAEAAKLQAQALQEAIDKTNKLSEVALAGRDAERGLQEAIDAASESVSENGRTLDVGTAKGRANQAAIDAIASATINKVNKDMAANASQNTVNATMARGRTAFINAAVAAGMEAGKARELATALGLIPRVVTSVVTTIYKEKYQGLRPFIPGGSASGPYAAGGEVRRFANGGFNGRVLGAGTATSDSIPAMLSNGEYVIKASSVKKAGVKNMDTLNRTGMLPMAGSGSRTVQVTLVNHGVIGSQIELQNWLAAELESLRRKGRF